MYVPICQDVCVNSAYVSSQPESLKTLPPDYELRPPTAQLCFTHNGVILSIDARVMPTGSLLLDLLHTLVDVLQFFNIGFFWIFFLICLNFMILSTDFAVVSTRMASS